MPKDKKISSILCFLNIKVNLPNVLASTGSAELRRRIVAQLAITHVIDVRRRQGRIRRRSGSE